jgi:undecaprenyl pyrophosphate synthase
VSTRRAPRPAEPAPSLAHLLLIGGTAHEWDAFDEATWQHRLELLAGLAHAIGAAWVTVRPNGGTLSGTAEIRTVHHDGVTVVVDTETDARVRFSRALAELVADGVDPADVSEKRLAHALLHAPEEPDLAVVLGPADRLPSSVSWEAAYAELVFLDVAWADLAVEHLASAVDEYRRRDRRFGGLDS